MNDRHSSSYKSKFSFDERISQSNKMRSQFPDRVQVICEKVGQDSKRFLIHKNLTMSQCIYIIRKKYLLKPDQALFCFINNTLVKTSDLISNIYEKHNDNILYITIREESTFG